MEWTLRGAVTAMRKMPESCFEHGVYVPVYLDCKNECLILVALGPIRANFLGAVAIQYAQ